jgi:hypothetical protein
MSDVHDRIEECITAFAADMSELVRRVAFESVSRVLAGEPAISPAKAPYRLVAPRTNAKRTRAQIERTVAALERHIRSTPGRRMEELSGDLGLTSRELMLPVQRLLRAGRIRTEGHKRATRYYPA